MNITLKKGSIENAPKGYVRISLVEKPKSATRFVKEGGTETLELGVGKPEEMNLRTFRTLCRAIIHTAKTNHVRKIAIQPARFASITQATPDELAQLAAENFEMANFEFNHF